MAKSVDSIDWSKYPPDRVEGLKYFFCKEPSDEAGPPTEEELKMMCLNWNCVVDMKVDNFVYWLMKRTKEKNFNGSEKRFQRSMPKIFAAIEKTGFAKYEDYQERYAHKNREYLERCAEWRKKKLWQTRYLDKLWALCSTWTYSDSEGDSDDSEEESNQEKRKSGSIRDSMDTFGSVSSVDTVVDTFTRYNSYLETESQDIQTSVADNVENGEIFENVGNEEIVDNRENVAADSLGEVNTQLFLPRTTSTQN